MYGGMFLLDHPLLPVVVHRRGWLQGLAARLSLGDKFLELIDEGTQVAVSVRFGL